MAFGGIHPYNKVCLGENKLTICLMTFKGVHFVFIVAPLCGKWTSDFSCENTHYASAKLTM